MHDLREQVRFNPLEGPYARDRLIIVILTDGDHDQKGNLAALKEEFQALGKELHGYVESKRLQIFFFNLSSVTTTGDSTKMVVAKFTKHLQAKSISLSPTSMDVKGLANQFASLKGGLLIQHAYKPVVRDVPSKGNRLVAPLSIRNGSCESQNIIGIYTSIFQVPPNRATAPKPHHPGKALVHKALLPVKLDLKKNRTHKLDLDLMSVLGQTELEPGKYLLVFSAATDKGLESNVVEAPVLEVPKPKKPMGLIVALSLLLLICLGAVFALFKRLLGS